MLGEVLPEPVEIVDADAHDTLDLHDANEFDDHVQTPAPEPEPKRASDSTPSQRRLKWTPPTHLAPATRAAALPPATRTNKPKLV